MFRRIAVITALALLAGAAVVAAAPPRTLDDDFVDLAERFPGFGGLYFDEGGKLNVFLKDMSQASFFEGLADDVEFRRGDFDFRELQAWRLDLRAPLLRMKGVVSLDVDERTNRVRVGMDRSFGRHKTRQIENALAAAGVPREAVTIDKVDPIYQLATLRDLVRPTVGGLQIRFSSFLCTLGFNASVGGDSGFVTNSHCTDKQGGVSRRRPTLYYQPLNQVPNEFIGTERVDPKYFKRKSGCPRGAVCRFSDSAWAEYDAGVSVDAAGIAETVGCNNGNLNIAGTHNITGVTSGSTPVGITVTKVGRTTGCSSNTVSESCVDTGVSGSNIVLLCQDIVNAAVGGGDSGSPVFQGSGNVTLTGILWGGNSAGTLFVFSPYSAVKSELGLD